MLSMHTVYTVNCARLTVKSPNCSEKCTILHFCGVNEKYLNFPIRVFAYFFPTDRAIFNRWTQICPDLYFRNPICLQIRNKSCKIYKTEVRDNFIRCNFTYSAQCTLYSVRAALVHSVQCTLLYVYSHCRNCRHCISLHPMS